MRVRVCVWIRGLVLVLESFGGYVRACSGPGGCAGHALASGMMEAFACAGRGVALLVPVPCATSPVSCGARTVGRAAMGTIRVIVRLRPLWLPARPAVRRGHQSVRDLGPREVPSGAVLGSNEQELLFKVALWAVLQCSYLPLRLRVCARGPRARWSASASRAGESSGALRHGRGHGLLTASYYQSDTRTSLVVVFDPAEGQASHSRRSHDFADVDLTVVNPGLALPCHDVRIVVHH